MFAVISPEGVTVGVVPTGSAAELEAVVRRVEEAAFRERAKRYEAVMMANAYLLGEEQQRELCKEYLLAELKKRLSLYKLERIG